MSPNRHSKAPTACAGGRLIPASCDGVLLTLTSCDGGLLTPGVPEG